MGVTAPTMEVLVGDRTYFTDGDGTRWRVYDVTDSDGQLRAHRPPHRGAAYRAFVGATGSRRQYRFRTGDTHVLSAAALERQLRASAITRAAPNARPGWAEQRLRDDA
jgi:hypothetical protein